MEKGKFQRELDTLIGLVEQSVTLVNMYVEYLKQKQAHKVPPIYEDYFEKLYYCVQAYLIIHVSKLFDNGDDCINVWKLKNDAIRYFDDIFPNHFEDDYYLENSLLSKEDMKMKFKTIFKKINDDVVILQDIRNKSGVAHGQFEPKYQTINIKVIGDIVENVCIFLNIIVERLYNQHNMFVANSSIHGNSLESLLTQL